jgi:hypothetical protein
LGLAWCEITPKCALSGYIVEISELSILGPNFIVPLHLRWPYRVKRCI